MILDPIGSPEVEITLHYCGVVPNVEKTGFKHADALCPLYSLVTKNTDRSRSPTTRHPYQFMSIYVPVLRVSGPPNATVPKY